MPTNTTLSIFDRVTQVGDEPLRPDVARYILRWGFNSEDQARVSELLAKLKAETITAEERHELEEFNRVNHLLTMLKSKARQALHVPPGG